MFLQVLALKGTISFQSKASDFATRKTESNACHSGERDNASEELASLYL